MIQSRLLLIDSGSPKTMRLSRNDYIRLQAAMTELYRIGPAEELPHRIMRVVGNLIGHSRVSFNETSDVLSGVGVSVSTPLMSTSETGLLPVLHRLWSTHPALRRHMRTNSLTVCDFAGEGSRQHFTQTALYNDYYQVIGTRDQLVALLQPITKRNELRCVSVSRTRVGFSETDHALLSLLAPHVNQALANARLLEAATGSTGRVVLDRSGRLCYANEQGSILWNQTEAFTCDRGQRASGTLLAMLMGQGARPGQLPASWTERGRSGWVTLRLVGESETYWVLSLEQVAVPWHTPNQRLTAREREVQHWVAHGKTNPEIAIILGMKPRTVDKHMENIREKLQVENRAGVMLSFLGGGQ